MSPNSSRKPLDEHKQFIKIVFFHNASNVNWVVPFKYVRAAGVGQRKSSKARPPPQFAIPYGNALIYHLFEFPALVESGYMILVFVLSARPAPLRINQLYQSPF
jgi:hypothetical protein